MSKWMRSALRVDAGKSLRGWLVPRMRRSARTPRRGVRPSFVTTFVTAWSLSLALLALLALSAEGVAQAPCGGFNQRACCIFQGETCVAGSVQANWCVDQLGKDACRCAPGIEIFSEGVCRQVAACGGENQRACCPFFELTENCGDGLAEIPGCEGNCWCGGTARGERASGMCRRAAPCGGAGQRACCLLERNLFGPACADGLREIPGCTGDCYCASPDPPGQVSSGTCTADTAMTEPQIDGTPSSTGPTCPMRGYADLHLHLFGHLAHGRGVLAGKSYSPNGVGDALSNDADHQMHGGHTLAEDTVGFGTNDADGIFGSGNRGAPTFNNWPNWHSTTHQQAYYKWLERAWRGGLRLSVMLAVTNEALCKSTRDQPNSVCEDSMAAVDAQLDEALTLERVIDGLAGGTGRGWFRIVRTPAEARSAISAGKLAVVLGFEVEHPFNCRSDGCRGKYAGETDLDYVNRQIDRYYDKGVRHIFPIHNFDNAFGGPATWQTSIDVGNRAVEGHWWRAVDCPGEDYGFKLGGAASAVESFFMNLFGFGGVENVPSHDGDASCNSLGLTTLGRSAIQRMMQKGMIIDVDHMSARAFDATLGIAEARTPKYPVVASHVQFFDRHVESIRHERMRTRAQLERIRDVGGMIAAMLKDDAQDTGNGGKRYTVPYGPVPNDCIHSSQTFAHAVHYAGDVMGGPVALGSDFNGIAAHVGPRFGSEACGGRIGLGGSEGGDRRRERQLQLVRGNRLRYPFTIPGFGTFQRQKTGERTFDLNHHGLAHVGMLPDLMAELENVGLPKQALERIYGSAEAYVAMWERATGVTPPPACPADTAESDVRLTVLDPTWYLNRYPDLKAAFGSDVQRARTHFLTYGIQEGRDASTQFSIGGYLARYPDLQRAFGSNYGSALNHWFTYGKAEGRSPQAAGTYMADARAAVLDPIFYANQYPDLKQAFGYKVPLLVQHWLNYGIAEGRLPNAGAKK